MTDARLPAHLEVSGLVRLVNAEGGFAAVLAKGEPDNGTIMVLTSCNARNYHLYERMPKADGERSWVCIRSAEDDHDRTLAMFLEKRRQQDPDLWIVELDIAQGERFIGSPPEKA